MSMRRWLAARASLLLLLALAAARAPKYHPYLKRGKGKRWR